MPSDLAKKKAAKKKEAAKARQRSKKPDEVNGEAEHPDTQQNGAESNGEKRTPENHFWIRCASLNWLTFCVYRYCQSDKGDG